MSKYLLKSAATIVLGLAATACSHDFDFVVQEEQKALDNAQATLGFYIPEDQDWKMSSEANVDLVIPGDANESYTVMVFSNNPLEDGIGYYLTKETLKGGQKLSADISYPAHLQSLVIGITDSNDMTTYKSASVVNGKLTTLTDIGTAARTRAIAVDYTLAEQNPSHASAPAQPAATVFFAEPSAPTVSFTIPQGTKEAVKANWKDNQTLYMNASTTQDLENPNNQVGMTLYIDGTVTFPYGLSADENNPTKIIVTENSNLTLTTINNNLSIYLAQNAIVNLPNNASLNGGNNGAAMLYLSTNSTVNADENLTLISKYVVYNNGGTFNVKTLNVDAAKLYNKGTLTVRNGGKINIFNGGGNVVNDGTITAPTFDIRAATNFLNNGTVTITGTTTIDNMNVVWKNAGTYTTEYFHIENTRDVFNNCKLTVNETFSFVKNSAMVLDGNNSVKCKNMSWGPDVDFYMSNYSLLQVDETLTSTSANQGYGLHGVGTEYSILKANKITYSGGGDQSRMNYYGKLYIDTEDHFDQGFKDQKKTDSSQPYYYYSTKNKTVMFRFLKDECPIKSTIDPGKCYHGYTPPGPPTPPVEPAVWSYAFEDNRARCDFDMNDVVLRVNVNKDDDTKFDVTLVAAGCEYDNYVYLGNQLITWANGSEVHDALGAAKGQMINTGRGVSKTPVTVTIPRNGNDPADADFRIWPYKKDGEFGNTADQKETTPITITQLDGSGKAPLGIIVPNKWAWPTERTIITEAYSQFVKWATNAVHVEATDWYDHPTTGKVVSQ